jgi:hypothetical protein
MPSSVSREALRVAVLGAAIGCGTNEVARPPAPPDCTGEDCNSRPGGGSRGGGGGTPEGGVDLDATVGPGADADAGTITVAYMVRQTVDSWFYALSNASGEITVRAVGRDGQVAPANDAGTTMPGTVPDVVPGPNWFFVEDATNMRRLAGTLQFADVDPRTPTVNLRAVSIDGLTNLVIDQVLWGPPLGTATLILNFRKAGRPVAGITVKRDALPAGTTVAYDSSGMYVSDTMVIGVNPATDAQGTAIVREIAGTQAFPALTSATLRYTLANSTTSFPAIEAKLARDAVTWMQIDVP